jgi:heterodisulfide reductase subunit D
MVGTGYDFAGFYGALSDAEHLQVTRQEMTWKDRYEPPTQPTGTLLSFGCAVQHTPHLMREATDILHALGIEVDAFGGRQFCCGRPYDSNGAPEASERVSTAAVQRFTAYAPHTLVNWCTSCQDQFDEVISQRTATPFRVVHYTQLLLERLQQLGDRIHWRRGVHVRPLFHEHVTNVEQQHVRSRIERMLALVPGVEIVGTVRTPELGNPCVMQAGQHVSVLTNIRTDEYRTFQADIQLQADAVGANTLLTPNHKCHREWSKFASPQVDCRCFLSIIADALGCGAPDRFQTYWRMGDPEAVLRAARPAWESWGLPEEEARRLAQRHFNPACAVDIPMCSCNGNCGCDSTADVTQIISAEELVHAGVAS